jgi:hypothetical protein
MIASKIQRLFPAVLLAGLLSLGASTAEADFGIADAGGALSATDGSFSRQAGAHADFTTHIAVNRVDPNEADGNLRDAFVDLPPGFVGDATIAPTCDYTQLLAASSAPCPIGSAVGYVTIEVSPNLGAIRSPLFNMVRTGGAPAVFAFDYFNAAVRIEPTIRAGDYGITARSTAISQALTPMVIDVTFWGVPADHSHDLQRTPNSETSPVPSPEPRRAFLSAPTACSATPLSFTASIDSWQNPGAFLARSFTADRDGTPFIFTGCDSLAFDPAAEVRTGSEATEAPTGLDIDLTVPQSESPDGLATAHVRKTVLTFPEGMAVAPGSAAGQGACTEAEIGIGSNDPPSCPDSSRIGTVKIATPLLDEELTGSLYLARPHRNPFGSLLAAYLAVKGPGFYLKLPGEVRADPDTGRLTASFDDQPQLPYESVSVSLREGPGAPLLTPRHCGTYETRVEMTSWASPVPVVLSSPMRIDEGCDAGGFAPTLKAGTTVPVGGAFSPFLLRVIRADGEQNVSRIEATLPEGLLAKLAGVGVCGDPEARTGTCPDSSRVGSATALLGAGPTPLQVPEAGKAPTAVYLAGPYKGAPLSLVVKVPAQAGPFDLGTVAVRSALRVDPTTTQVSAETDPMPQILEGIPISYRDVRVEIDRPEFTVNPTNCEARKVRARITGSAGATASPSAPFAAADCERLGFSPTLQLSMTGSTRRAGDPALSATLKAPKGQANLASTTVILPKTMFIDQRHVDGPCTRVQFAADACPASSILGTATAWSPLLEAPLTGPVYFRSNGGERRLPDIVADLDGQIHVTLAGFIDSVKAGKEGSRVRTRFQNVPDAPVSRFVLQLKGGSRGLLQNSVDLCKVPQFATVKAEGQNGKAHDLTQKITTGCRKGARRGGTRTARHGRG